LFAAVKGNRLGMIPTELTVSLFTKMKSRSWLALTSIANLPNSDKFDVDVNGKSLLECSALRPTLIIIAAVHMVRKRNLLMVAAR
jgi:hypothetical protein